MELVLLLGVVVVAGAATWSWAILEQRIPLMSMFAVPAWGTAAFGAGNIEQTSRCCVTTQSEPMLQLLFGGLALLSLGALVLHILGEYPPGESPEGDQPLGGSGEAPDRLSPDGGTVSESRDRRRRR